MTDPTPASITDGEMRLTLEHERLQHRDYVMGLLAELSTLREADTRLRSERRKLQRELKAKTARLAAKNEQLAALRERLRGADGPGLRWGRRVLGRRPRSDSGA